MKIDKPTIQLSEVFTNATNANTVTLQSGVTSASYTLTLPTAVAAVTGYVLTSTDSGVLSWAAAGGAGDMVLADVQTVTGLKTFDTTKLAVKGSSTGSTAIASANAGASDYTATLQAGTGTLAYLTDITGTNSNTNTGDQTITNSSDATSHTVTLSASGGTIQFIEGTNVTLTTGGTAGAGTLTIAAAGSAGATTALDNLASVAINTSLVSDTDNTDDLGTTLVKWANLFVTTIGATATRVTKGWFTDLEVTNAIAGSITGNAGTATAAASQVITDNAIITADAVDIADDDYARFTANGLEGRSYTEVKQDLDLEIGTDVQAYDAGLTDIAGLAVTDGNIIVGNGTNWVAESGATARTSLGLGTGDSPQFTGIELGDATDTTLSRVSAGVVAIEGNNILTSATGLALAGGTMTGNITLGENTSIALDPVGSADGKYTGITVTGVAGYSQAFGDLNYLAVADSRWELADADAATTADRMLAMVVVAGTDGNACTLLLQGIIRADAKFPALTVGAPVYVGETAGEVQVAIPTGVDNVIRRVGYALTADELYFNPSMDSQTSVA